MLLKYYLEMLHYEEMPEFLKKYLQTPSLLRLKDVGYFCGMDFASKDIYPFKESISRFDHSFTVALLVYSLTHDKKETLAGLFHDIATPCFSHVIDYMNQDYEKQESTEEFTEYILKKEDYLKHCLKEDKIFLEEISNFKKYSVVDNERPKLCADRLDGVILTGISWTQSIQKEDIQNIIQDITLFSNEYKEKEIGFQTLEVAKRVLEVSKEIDYFCHTSEDNYMMMLLAQITQYAIQKHYICYEDLYFYTEVNLFQLLKSQNDKELQNMIYEFEHKKLEEIPPTQLNVKVRKLNPLVNGKRML